MIDEVIGNYRILEKLGEGGMGEVFRGMDLTLEREVAIKVLRHELTHDQNLVERFRMEAVALAKLNHPNIVTLHNFFIHDDQYFMVLELVQGETLDKLIKRYGVFPWQQAILLIKEALGGLEHAHRLGVIHRDIKPANMVLTPAGILKLMDFGIARILKTSRITRTGHFFGTLEYMSPEQIQGHDVDARSDVYSVGIVLYEMLTGRVPFERNTDYELIRAQVEESPLSIRAFVPQVPQQLERTVLRALAKAPKDRFQSAVAFRDELDAVFETRLYKRPNRKSRLVNPNKRLKLILFLVRNQFVSRAVSLANRLFKISFAKDYAGILIAFILISLSVSLVGVDPWRQMLWSALIQLQQRNQPEGLEQDGNVNLPQSPPPKADDEKTLQPQSLATPPELIQLPKPLSETANVKIPAPSLEQPSPIEPTQPSPPQKQKVENGELSRPVLQEQVKPSEAYQPPKPRPPIAPSSGTTGEKQTTNNINDNKDQRTGGGRGSSGQNSASSVKSDQRTGGRGSGQSSSSAKSGEKKDGPKISIKDSSGNRGKNRNTKNLSQRDGNSAIDFGSEPSTVKTNKPIHSSGDQISGQPRPSDAQPPIPTSSGKKPLMGPPMP